MSFFHGKVELKDTKNCFISLPPKWTFKNHQNNFNLIVLKVIFLDDVKCDQFIYVTWNGTHNCNGENYVTFDRLFATKIGIQEDESILVQAVNESRKFDPCISCNMRPLSEDDYQLVMANFGEIENELMNQIRIFTTAFFAEKQHKFNIFPVWLKNCSNTPIYIEILNYEPKNPNGLIFVESTKLLIHSPLEEVSFEPELNNENNMFYFEENNSAIKAVFGLIKSIIPKPQLSLNSNQTSSSLQENKKLTTGNKSIPLYRGKPFMLRVLPCCSNLKLGNLANYCTAFISDLYFQSVKEKYCLIKVKKLLSINEFNDLKKLKNESNASYSIDTSSLSLDDKFHTLFVDRLLKTFDDRTEFVLLVFANKNCPPDSIMLNDTFRIQHSISATSYVQLAEIGSNETNLNINHFDNVHYLSIPSVNQLTLYPIDYNFFWSDNIVANIKKEFKKLFDTNDNLCFKSSLFATNSFVIKLSNINFFLYYNEVPFLDLDRCDFEKLRKLCFLVDSNVEISIKNVSIKNNISKLMLKLSKDSKQLDCAHLSLLYDESFLLKPFGGFSQIFDKCVNWIDNGLQRLENTPTLSEKFLFLPDNLTISNLFCSLLICGTKGSGKSTLVEQILHYFIKQNYAFSHIVHCSFIKGKRIESLQKSWTNLIQEAIQRQPSILVFEDLDEIAYYSEEKQPNSGSESGENVSPESVYCERVAYVFRSIVNSVKQLKSSSSFSKVVILATAKSVHLLHKLLQNGNIFNETIELLPPDSKRRADIIQEIITKKDLSLPGRQLKALINFNLKRLSRATKSFNPDDLNQFIDIALHNTLVQVLSLNYRNIESNVIKINEQNIDYALKEFVPNHLQGMNLQINSQRCLSDVGGLNEVKEIILNTISLPSKYPKLYAQLPLKPQNSLLLYGMPGTGKTILVEAIAHESGLNFIGVKGPELLSKYIGASEQSVRDLFARAQQAAPCILFFDEFDSLAPRRGHDSTGVTDRIVNQLLTLLDGLEEMQRDVYILAATSRPDLIDLALLRPGRFDRCLLCNLPTDAERAQIFTALSRKLPIDTDIDIDMEWFAKNTHNFTGADIQALLYTAYLNALKRLPTTSAEEMQNSSYTMPLITGEDIRQATSVTSASNVEIEKFNAIYERFTQQLAGKIVGNLEPKMATLA